MRRTTVATFVALLLALPIAHAQAPTAPPEAKRMSYFVGTWTFTGTAKDTPMGKGGPVTFRETCEAMPGGFSVVCRSEGKGPMGPTKAVSIMGYDAARKTYTYTAAESNMAPFTALGQNQGQTWTWTMDATEGGQKMTMRVTIKEGGPKGYDMNMEMSMDGKTFAPVMSGKATRAES
jgi:hypothetical protein